MLTLQAQPHRIALNHLVDGKMPAEFPQEIDIAKRQKPFRIVRHDRVGLALAEAQKSGKDGSDAGLVFLDRLGRQDFPALILARWIADPGRAAAHQGDRLVAALLQPIEHHDLNQAAHMKARRGAIETDIGGNPPPGADRVQAFRIGDLVDKTAFGKNAQEI